MIKKHSRAWQPHLQQIRDYLIEDEGTWWKVDGDRVEFFDVDGYPSQEMSGPKLHHFRSNTLQSEASYLKECWSKCVKDETVIPIHVIRLDQENGTIHRVFTDYLGDNVQNENLAEIQQVPTSLTQSQTEVHQGEKEHMEKEDDDGVIQSQMVITLNLLKTPHQVTKKMRTTPQ